MELNDIVEFGERKYEVVENLNGESEKKRKNSFWMGFFTIALFIVAFAGGFIAIRLLHYPTCIRITVWMFLVLIGAYVLYTALHEGIRAIVFMIAGVPKKDLTFGASFKAGMVYCISKEPVGMRAGRVAMILPFLLVSLPLLIYSVAIGDVIYLIGSALLLTISGADFWRLWKLRKRTKDFYLLEEKPVKGAEELQAYVLKEIS